MEAASPIELPYQQASLSTPRIAASPWIVLVVLALGEFMILLDTTIVAVALPKMTTDLHASLDQVLWVVNAYTLVFAVLLITSGRIGDMVGSKKMFLLGLAIFTASSLACGLATDSTLLITFRVVQGLGGAMLMPQTLSIITSIFPPHQRGAAFGLWGAVAGLAAAGGPTLGGLLVSAFSWRAVFFPNVPIGLGALVLAFLVMPEVTDRRRRRLDLMGVALATGGLVAGIYGLIEGQKYNWGRISNVAAFDIGPVHAGLVSIPIILLASVVLLVLLIVWELRQDEPLLPISLFSDRNFTIGGLSSAILNFLILGLFLPLTLFLQSVLGFSALHAGLALMPQALAAMVTAPLAGRFADKINGKYLLVVGFVLVSAGLAIVVRATSLDATLWTFTPGLVVAGLGMGMIVAPTTALAMRTVAPSAAGAASGFINTVRQVGAAVGGAVVGAILQNKLALQLHSQAVHSAVKLPAKFRPAFVAGFDNLASSGLQVGTGQTGGASVPHGLPASVAHSVATLSTTVFNQAFLNVIEPSYVLPVGLALAGAFAALWMRTPPVARQAAVAAGQMFEVEVAQIPVPMGPPVIKTQMVSRADLEALKTRASIASDGGPFLLAEGGDRYPIAPSVSLGRMPGNVVMVDDQEVSRNHALVTASQEGIVVRDLNSVNGTRVNGRRIDQESLLHDGDTITVGSTSFTFRNDFERMRPRLQAVGEARPAEVAITRTLSLGRVPGNDIVIPDSRVSRRHAEIELQGGRVVLRDLESLNGTRINGQLVLEEKALRDGDIISIGDAAYVYRCDATAPG